MLSGPRGWGVRRPAGGKRGAGAGGAARGGGGGGGGGGGRCGAGAPSSSGRGAASAGGAAAEAGGGAANAANAAAAGTAAANATGGRGRAEGAGGTGQVLRVRGGARLEGCAPVSGAKNSALALLAASLLCDGEVALRHVPVRLRDVQLLGRVLESVGALVRTEGGAAGEGAIAVDARALSGAPPDAAAVRGMRASILTLAPLLARVGEAEVALPGGCAIGARPVDLHVRGLRALGAEVEVRGGVVVARAPAGGRLRGARVYLDFPSVGATETVLMAAVLAEGTTLIENAAQEPEVEDLAGFLNAMGAHVAGAGTSTLEIRGAQRLGGCEYTVIPDRIEAGTFLTAAAMTYSAISVAPVMPNHLTAVLAKLEATGCQVGLDGPMRLRLVPPPQGELRATDVTTLPYPGFPTDMQPQFTALLAGARGAALVRETVFENRLGHVAELGRMGAHLRQDGSAVLVEGRGRGGGVGVGGGCDVSALSGLWGANVAARNLREGAALTLAGLAADGETLVGGVEHIDRGYEGFDEKLRALGADVTRLEAGPGLMDLAGPQD